jgi:hypothetical protein
MAWDGWPYSNIQHILYHVTWPWRIIFEKYKESSIYYSKGGLMPWKYFEHEIVPPVPMFVVEQDSLVEGWMVMRTIAICNFNPCIYSTYLIVRTVAIPT